MLKNDHRPSKSYNPGLTFGVSAESPESFHIKFIHVLDSKAKNNEISKRDKKPGIFWSNLKRNNAVVKPSFMYEDYNNSTGFNYDTMKFDDRLDLIKTDQERVRCKTPFFKKWKKQEETLEKFKIYQGNFTATANQAFAPRLLNGKIETIKTILNKTKINRRTTPEPSISSSFNKIRYSPKKKTFTKTKYQGFEFNSPEVVDKEINHFENELIFVPERKRWCYNL